MNVKYMFSLLAVVLLFLLAYAGVEAAGLQVFFGIVVPYLAFAIFLLGFIRKVVDWARSPVPFRIPTTCGQQQSLPWIKQAKFDNPSTSGGVIVRMILEILTFRSLFRNLKFKQKEGGKLFYGLELFLWLGALAFHYAFLVVCIRHLRFFTEPTPFFVKIFERLDGFFQFGLPVVYLSGIVLLAATLYLLLRRMLNAQVNYISLAADYFPLFLIIGIAVTGIMMRYFTKVDVVAIKSFTMGLVTFHPVIPEGVGGLFYVHLFLVSVLLIYFPFSKLMHMGGVFMSPTRNLTGNTRAVRHVNPWNYPVKVHTYEEYEDHFRDLMIEAGLPVENKE
ncbi:MULTISPECIES: sulfate reduction electron transfer complex DsrMKJOP subunit DsrM [Desulfococcus]|uniref:Nitrate reductase gamma subunit n=1 Tax=Desulfococcus multivorans DSM 2059 TaxID=1121405 RepID=S7TVP1_DESML|nr:sulfate reduction electron transfer complex DsrMKJOP subunit DsrM [Desulfococcus multivorans]AOY60341.1 DsrM: predicted redox complex linked to DsrAB, transmembrane subunit [Desulfococcus multivorans]AQV02445.1 menaquinol oxidoreductase [Desulfococcus multivorans]EPR41127.1 Nitrate reductase gamma subunit [Desulfococcus multivorans DSM 2059]SJZ59308.1 putative sulfite reductase-associated electron transfer protein DsrM [Desulfococcus multivorans DSM 2059]